MNHESGKRKQRNNVVVFVLVIPSGDTHERDHGLPLSCSRFDNLLREVSWNCGLRR